MSKSEHRSRYLGEFPGVMPYIPAVAFLHRQALDQRLRRNNELAEILDQAANTLDRLRMHDATLEKPSDCEWVLCYVGGTQYLILRWDWFGSRWVDQFGHIYHEKTVTSWMSLKSLRLLRHVEYETNLDAIRRMSDEWFIDFFLALYHLADGSILDTSTLWCDGKGECIGNGPDDDCEDCFVRDCVVRWLNAKYDGLFIQWIGRLIHNGSYLPRGGDVSE